MPQNVNRSSRHFITVFVEISLHGYANGNLEYSSIITKRYRFFELDGSGPLKSTLILSSGWVAFIRVAGGGLWKIGLISEHVLHELHTSLTSAVEKGKFFDRTKCNSRATPGWHKFSWI